MQVPEGNQGPGVPSRPMRWADLLESSLRLVSKATYKVTALLRAGSSNSDASPSKLHSACAALPGRRSFVLGYRKVGCRCRAPPGGWPYCVSSSGPAVCLLTKFEKGGESRVAAQLTGSLSRPGHQHGPALRAAPARATDLLLQGAEPLWPQPRPCGQQVAFVHILRQPSW